MLSKRKNRMIEEYEEVLDVILDVFEQLEKVERLLDGQTRTKLSSIIDNIDDLHVFLREELERLLGG